MIKPFLQWCLLVAYTSAALADDTLSVDAAFERATRAQLTLIDIRAPRNGGQPASPAHQAPLPAIDISRPRKLAQ